MDLSLEDYIRMCLYEPSCVAIAFQLLQLVLVVGVEEKAKKHLVLFCPLIKEVLSQVGSKLNL